MEEEFLTKDGRKVFIVIDDDDYNVTVLDQTRNKKIGKIEFIHIEGVDAHSSDYLQLAWMYMDLVDASYKHQGIGRRCLQLVSDFSGMEITASDNDGHKKEDGSHLTGDAPGFVAKMRSEGII